MLVGNVPRWPEVPAAITELAEGDPHRFLEARAAGAVVPEDPEQALGMTESFICQEWEPYGGPAAILSAVGLGIFLFWPTRKFPPRRRAVPREISRRSVKGADSGARSALVMGNGRRYEAWKQRLSPSAIAHNRCSARDHAVSRA